MFSVSQHPAENLFELTSSGITSHLAALMCSHTPAPFFFFFLSRKAGETLLLDAKQSTKLSQCKKLSLLETYSASNYSAQEKFASGFRTANASN